MQINYTVWEVYCHRFTADSFFKAENVGESLCPLVPTKCCFLSLPKFDSRSDDIIDPLRNVNIVTSTFRHPWCT
jgi:hypothetical protein